MKYLAFIYPEADNTAYNVVFADLDGCATFGATFEEAVDMAQEAMFGWLESYKNKNNALPKASKLSDITDEIKKELELPSYAIPQFIEYKQPKAERINITIRSDILKEIDSYVKKAKISRSAFLQEAAYGRLTKPF